MKKVILIISTEVVLIGATVYADRATRVNPQARRGTRRRPTPKPFGQPAPMLPSRNLDGKDATLSQYKAQVVLVNFLGHLVRALLHRNSLAHRNAAEVRSERLHRSGHLYGRRRARAPSLPSSPRNVSTSTARKLPMNYPIVIGNDEVADKFGGFSAIPRSFLISRDGKIVKKVSGSDQLRRIHQSHRSLNCNSSYGGTACRARSFLARSLAPRPTSRQIPLASLSSGFFARLFFSMSVIDEVPRCQRNLLAHP